MAHHGIGELHGINAMCKNDPNHQGRFGRLFPQLKASYTDPQHLSELGKQGGPMDGGVVRNPSVSIPMGFVFLGQFIDHDITLDTTSALDRVNDVDATENFRTPALDLDNIYGAGPEASNYLYKDGLYLLTGKDGTALEGQAPGHRENDLARNSSGTAIIGDFRNDENRIISQMQLAFINYHNKVVDIIKNDEESSNLDNKEIYEKAREYVTWSYQWIIIHEFLPLMVGKPMVSKILGSGRRFYRPKPNKTFIPIEFSTAAYRFGHSLAPQKLKVKKGQTRDFELFGRTLGFGFSPISDDKQIVEWSTMFDCDPADPAQRTDKLDTKMPSDLLNLPFIRKGEKSLATRNLNRGQSFLIPSGENVAECIGVEHDDLNKVKAHIKNLAPNVDLSNGIPLWFYILAEAECMGRLDLDGNKPGEGLGEVGGTIVAETLIGLIEKDSSSFLSKDRSWTPKKYGINVFTMADLVKL